MNSLSHMQHGTRTAPRISVQCERPERVFRVSILQWYVLPKSLWNHMVPHDIDPCVRARFTHTHVQIYSLVVERDVGPPHEIRIYSVCACTFQSHTRTHRTMLEPCVCVHMSITHTHNNRDSLQSVCWVQVCVCTFHSHTHVLSKILHSLQNVMSGLHTRSVHVYVHFNHTHARATKRTCWMHADFNHTHTHTHTHSTHSSYSVMSGLHTRSIHVCVHILVTHTHMQQNTLIVVCDVGSMYACVFLHTRTVLIRRGG